MTNPIHIGVEPRWPTAFAETTMPTSGASSLDNDGDFSRQLLSALDTLEQLVKSEVSEWSRDYSDRSLGVLGDWLEGKVAELHGWTPTNKPSSVAQALRQKARDEDHGPPGYEPLMFLVGCYVGEALCARLDGAGWVLYQPPERSDGAVHFLAMEPPNTPMVFISDDHAVNPVGALTNIFRQREPRTDLQQFVRDHMAMA